MINLNRFRKKKAREEKERRAETNRRLHGRTKLERAQEEAQKARLESKLDGAFLIPERISLDEIPGIDQEDAFDALEAAADQAMSLSDLSRDMKSGAKEDE